VYLEIDEQMPDRIMPGIIASYFQRAFTSFTEFDISQLQNELVARKIIPGNNARQLIIELFRFIALKSFSSDSYDDILTSSSIINEAFKILTYYFPVEYLRLCECLSICENRIFEFLCCDHTSDARNNKAGNIDEELFNRYQTTLCMYKSIFRITQLNPLWINDSNDKVTNNSQFASSTLTLRTAAAFDKEDDGDTNNNKDEQHVMPLPTITTTITTTATTTTTTTNNNNNNNSNNKITTATATAITTPITVTSPTIISPSSSSSPVTMLVI
jgi:hypothetical protein